MTISVDWENLVIESTASITDLPDFHATLRDFEDDTIGMIYPVTHTWKALDLGGGAYFYGCDLINGWQLKFVGAGPFQINGNLNGTIIDTGVQVERKTSAAYVTTAIGGSGPSAADIAAAILAAAQITPIYSNVKQVNNITIAGAGVAPTFDEQGNMTDPGDPWVPAP
jgi:hypothetical protein